MRIGLTAGLRSFRSAVAFGGVCFIGPIRPMGPIGATLGLSKKWDCLRRARKPRAIVSLLNRAGGCPVYFAAVVYETETIVGDTEHICVYYEM